MFPIFRSRQPKLAESASTTAAADEDHSKDALEGPTNTFGVGSNSQLRDQSATDGSTSTLVGGHTVLSVGEQAISRASSRRTRSLHDLDSGQKAGRRMPASSALTSSSSLGNLSTNTLRGDNDDGGEDDGITILSASHLPVRRTKTDATSNGRSNSHTRQQVVPVIVIPDSPPSKKHFISLEPSRGLFGVQRVDLKASEHRKPRWPTHEEHCDVVRSKNSRTVANNGRWTGSSRVFQQHSDETRLPAPTAFSPSAPPILESVSGAHDAFSTCERTLLCGSVLSSTVPGSTPNSSSCIGQSSATPRSSRRSDISAQLWTSKYCPSSSLEVLGTASRRSASLLKDWLAELALSDGTIPSGKRRRPVIRGAGASKRQRPASDDLNDFIASSDEDCEWQLDDNDSDSDTSFPRHRSSASHSAQECIEPSVFPQLSNLILLNGPHASGKTSSVHAVARELGWDVFELNPGSRRNAKDVERAVGDVARNHLVRRDQPSALSPRKGPLERSIFSMMRAASKSQGDIEIRSATAEITGDPSNTTKQSLILLDEVDVLFGDEETFWIEVANLARKSRRPIVMTCSDPSTVPFTQLGLQKVVAVADKPALPFLVFEAPEVDFVEPFLSVVAQNEGCDPPADHSMFLYPAVRSLPAHLSWHLDGQSHALPHPDLANLRPQPDLRQALLQMQVAGVQQFYAAGRETASGDHELSPCSKSLTDSEQLSFLDAYLSMSHADRAEIEEPLAAAPEQLRELGGDPLLIVQKEKHYLSQYAKSAELYDQVLRRIEAGFAGPLLGLDMKLKEARSATVIQACTILSHGDLSDSGGHGRAYLSVFTDYLPFIRLISAAEDTIAVLREEGTVIPNGSPHVRRSNRLSKVERPTRRFEWTLEQAEAMALSAFPL